MTNLMHNYVKQHVYYYTPLHVSSNSVLIIRRPIRINTASGIVFSVTEHYTRWSSIWPKTYRDGSLFLLLFPDIKTTQQFLRFINHFYCHMVRHPRCVFMNYNWIYQLSNTTTGG